MLQEANKDVIAVFKDIKVSMFMINKKIGNLENHSNGLEKILNMTESKLWRVTDIIPSEEKNYKKCTQLPIPIGRCKRYGVFVTGTLEENDAKKYLNK